MKRILFILLAFSFQLLAISIHLHAQVENVIVEKYYISDASDAKDITGGKLEEGSTTYRIYIDLAKGTVLKKIYGDANYALKIESTDVFYNNTDRGTSFGKDINDKKINENTVALDSWLTLGQATKKHMGVLKNEDTDGSLVSGVDRTDGLLENTDPSIGIPLTQSDGLLIANSLPSSWLSYGFKENNAAEDSTIFGEIKKGTSFISNNCGLQNSGVIGMTSDNKVLVAQLTTKGEISFELNIEVEENNGAVIKTVKYVANGDKLLENEKICPYLKYPQYCGCKDPNFLEFKPDFACEDIKACKTIMVLGCMDPMACNYDPHANYNIKDLCCYPGKCNDRDISLVCPGLGKNETKMEIFPNPVQEKIGMKIQSGSEQEAKLIIYDYVGKVLLEKNIGVVSENTIHNEDVSGFSKGIYFIKIFKADGNYCTNKFLKN